MRGQLWTSAIGGLLLLGGGAVMVDWLARYPLWDFVFPSGTVMVFQAALCTALSGLGLVAASLLPAYARPVRIVAGLGLVAISLLMLGEVIFAFDLGIDLTALHRWYPDANPHPGRMAPHAAIAFLLIGAGLMLGAAGGRRKALSHAIPAAILTLGLLGLAGYTLLFDLTYSGYDVSRMPVATAIGVILFGIGLALERQDASRHSHARAASTVPGSGDDGRIYAFLGVAVTVLAMGVFVSYGSIEALIERAIQVENASEVHTAGNRQIARQWQELQQNTNATRLVIVFGNLIGFTILLYAAWLLMRQNKAMNRMTTALQDSNRFLDSLVEHIPDMILVKDAEQLRYVRFNKAGEELLGLSREQMLGKNDHDLFSREKADLLASRDRAVLASNAVADFAEEPVHTRDNGVRILHTVKIPVCDEKGQPRHLLDIATDMTEYRLAMQELKRSQQELRALSKAANESLESERRRTARELHDELGQTLTALKMDASWIMERLPAGQEALAAKLDKMKAMLDGTTMATRRIAANLRPLMLDDLGFLPAAEWLVESFREHSGIACALRIDDPGLDLQEPCATTVFRILQESLTNIARHAQATAVEISIGQGDGKVKLTVRDNGRGFFAGEPRKPGSHGLLGLRERVYLLDGEIRIDSAPGNGTLIEVRIPLVRPAAEFQDYCV